MHCERLSVKEDIVCVRERERKKVKQREREKKEG